MNAPLMFTGIIEALGLVQVVEERPPGRRLTIEGGGIAEGIVLGDSVAISGCCLTVVAIQESSLDFDVGPETLSRTILGRLTKGDTVNLERAVRVGDRLGGHFVSGHVDAVGTLMQRDDAKDWCTFWFHMPDNLRTQMASKGSVAVDGVSLTLVAVESDRFSVPLIPHTLAVTTLGRLQVGDQVNLETDILAKYVEASRLRT